MTVTTLQVLGGSIRLTDLPTGSVQIETLFAGKNSSVALGAPEIQSLLTNLRHHAQSRKRPRASVASASKQPPQPGGESEL